MSPSRHRSIGQIFRILKIPLDKSYFKLSRVDETGKIVNWDPERQAECLEYGLPKYILPKPVGAADVGLKWLWPGRIPQGRVTEKFSKREFLAENAGTQPVSAEPSAARGANEPHRQPAPAAQPPNAPWTLNSQKTSQSPVSLATENRPPMTSPDDGPRFLENVKS